MAERRPIYSAQTAGQQIGYIEDNEAFDLFDRPCAIYDSGTSLLRDPKHNAVVGYVSLADIFVGSSSMARELFSSAAIARKDRPVLSVYSDALGTSERARASIECDRHYSSRKLVPTG